MFKKFVIKSDGSEVKEFKLKEFSLRVTDEAEVFEKSELVSNKGFVIDKNSSKKSGLSYLKDKRIANKISEEVSVLLEKEKSAIYEEYKNKGFEEGLAKGIEEGRSSVEEEYKIAVEGTLAILDGVAKKISSSNKNLIKNNEKDMVDLIKLAVEKFCQNEIQINDDLVKNIITKTFEDHANDKKIKCILSNSDYANLTTFNTKIKNDCLPQEIEFEASDKVAQGGVIFELENGVVDKSVETRFAKIWEALDNNGK